ncbi:hypothetical protein AKJ09_10790 [Labilithrix luteola]|uniref:Uncharacterized protein n=1 Tax=Labilithrix luteola TaxID=1391654 RepID=A0A0K1QEM8_9BACT|nr:hypothetical protein [Labilithrix luteola]AKV04127.1 hypothetical protein AKJ09_10790 [Labilithrix luteola]
MTADLYRDAWVGIRARLAELSVRVREREAEVTEDFWESLEPNVRGELGAMREALEIVYAESASPASFEFEQLARAEQLLANYLEELERLIRQLPAVEAEWCALPDEVPDPPSGRDSWTLYLPTDEEMSELVRSFTTTVRERDRTADIITDNRRSCLARFHDRGAPFTLRATAHTNGKGQIIEVGMWLMTSVPRAMPKLVVRHETLALSFGKAIGLKHEVEVGEPSFDGLFLIQAAKETVTRLLVPSIRTLLMTLARFDVPTLEIDPRARTASLQWRFEPSSVALDAAVRVLANIREARAEVRFKK